MKNQKGMTLIEVLGVVTVAGLAGTTALGIISDGFEKENLEIVSNDVSNVINGFDKRLSNDKYDLSLWNYLTTDYTFSNRQQVSDFLTKELNAIDAPGCGAIDNWVPVKDSVNTAQESYKDKYKFVSCGMWSQKMPFGLNAKAQIINDGVYVTGFNLDLFFDNQKDFEDNMLSLKSILTLAREKDASSESGTHLYQFVSSSTNNALDSRECIVAGVDCMLRASFTGSDQAYQYLYTNGNNNMVGSKIKFQDDVASTDAIQTCYRFKELPVGSGNWTKVDNVYCGIGYGYQDGNSLYPKLDYVEINTHSVTSDKVFLSSTCDFEDTVTGNIKSAPCGMYNEDGINKAVANYHEITATDALIGSIETVTLNANQAKIKNDLTVDGETTLKGELNVAGKSDFTGVVTIEGSSTDQNLIVETSASMKSLDLAGSLSVYGTAQIGGDVNISQSLNVAGKISAQRVKVNESIGASDLGTSCIAEGNGTIVYFSAGQFSDLAVCANNKWKLVNTQPNQVVAFNGVCPTGFKDFDNADGRTLMGAGSLVEDDGQTYTYTQGGIGGQSQVGLTISQIPAHQHETEDAWYSEKYGPLGSGNTLGSGDSDTDNNLYTRQVMSSSVGGGQAHENRMSYYVVNWCTYEG